MEPSLESKERIKGDVLLSCNHMLHFDTRPPHKKDVVWCRRCERDRDVTEIYSGSAYRLKCTTCGYTKGKQAKIAAERGAVTHRMKRGFHHRVELVGPTNTIEQVYESSEDPVNISLPEVPPF